MVSSAGDRTGGAPEAERARTRESPRSVSSTAGLLVPHRAALALERRAAVASRHVDQDRGVGDRAGRLRGLRERDEADLLPRLHERQAMRRQLHRDERELHEAERMCVQRGEPARHSAVSIRAACGSF